jgi:transposase
MPKGKTYSDEFKQEALKLVNEQNMRPSQVARDLGIDGDTLRRWLRDHERTPAELASSSAAAELTRLRRENDQLRMERDILKKALGIFSRMPQ